MKVTIIGAGTRRAFPTRVVAGGHEVDITDRDLAEARKPAAELGPSATAVEPEAGALVSARRPSRPGE